MLVEGTMRDTLPQANVLWGLGAVFAFVDVDIYIYMYVCILTYLYVYRMMVRI